MTKNLKNIHQPKLTVVGAGTGDPELITLKAIKALKNADVVLYDALANEELLQYCSAECEQIYVGKRGYKKCISQEEINELIVEKAQEKGHVVRLKGGDPFIFGRGNEEIQFAEERGVITAYIPGISSIMAGGNLHIPLTARHVADGFWVITGHKSDGSLSKDLQLAAQSSATVVILMGMGKLPQISQIYTNLGLENKPAAIIQNSSLENQKFAIGTAGNLSQMAEKEELENPAVIIIGEVVSQNIAHEIAVEMLEKQG